MSSIVSSLICRKATSRLELAKISGIQPEEVWYHLIPHLTPRGAGGGKSGTAG